MTLIAILISLAVEYFLGALQDLRRFEWFAQLTAWVRARVEGQPLADGPVGVVLVIGPILLVVWLVYALLGSVAWVLAFLFSIAVLIYSLGPRVLEQDAGNYVDAIERGDPEGASWYASAVLNRDSHAEPVALAQEVKEAVFVQANERLLGVLFWFAVLGPLGALLFRLAVESRKQAAGDTGGYAKSVDDLHAILIWLPARLAVVGFALAGSFVDTVGQWRALADLWTRPSEWLLVTSGLGAMRQEQPLPGETLLGEAPDIDGVRAALALVRRTLIIWLAVLALLTLAGWAT